MAAIHGSLKLKFACAVLTAGVALPLGVGFALAAEQPTAEDIIKALKPVAKTTRSLTMARNAEDTRFVETLRNRPTRSLTSVERDRMLSASFSAGP